MWFEKVFVKTHDNADATKILFDSIVRDSTVSSVFFFGDVTAMGSYNFHWVTIDSFLTQLKSRHIHTYATAGNHDYLLSSSGGKANFIKRFPDYKETGYTVRSGGFALIFLNSIFGELNAKEEARQLVWYTHELQSLDQDSTIRIVAVGCHHSPYSNSTIVGHSEKVRETFVPPFLKSNKARVFLSGHAHTFQHFIDTTAQKHFLVIGGGGGLLHKLNPPDPGDLQDQFPGNGDYRMFHYVHGTLTPGTLLLEVMMLNEDLSGPKKVYSISIPVPRP